jgi:DEAD/DEAH box helicase domain-containing protein
VRRVAGYKKIRYYTHENIGYGPVSLPDQELHTTALWWQLPQEALDEAFASRQDALDGFLGAATALHTVASVRVMAESRDLMKSVGSGDASAFVERDRHGRGQWRAAEAGVDAERFTPTVYLYDNYPGGVGLSDPLFRVQAELVREAAALLDACSCRAGCPACIGPVLAADEEAAATPKAQAARVLALLRGA